MADLHLPAALRSEIEGWAREAYPSEACGLLIGRQSGETVETVRVVRARNVNTARAHDRYELDPEELLAADRAAQAAGLELVGVWHSHPDHPARPSETDRAAAWPDWSYVIAPVTADGVGALRSWRLDGNRQFFEEHIK